MRVTFVAADWRRSGGVGAYLWRLAKALTARGDAVQVVHGDRETQVPGSVAGVFVDGCATYAQPPSAASAAARAALDAMAGFRPDVVHVQDGNNFTLEAAVRAHYPATKSLHVYDFCPSNTKYHHAGERACTHRTSAMCLPRLAYRRCTTSRRPSVWLALQRRARDANRNNAGYDALIVASEHVRRQAIATGYPAGQVRVVPYFVDTVDPAPPEPAVILTAGRLVREKGFDLFLDALGTLTRPWRAIIAGDGMERAALERHARQRGLADAVTFAGWQDEAGMDAWYRRASIVVMPSRWPEPSGILGLEAMAHARPVVAFAVGGIPEWLEDGVTGRLVPPLDAPALGRALDDLLADPARAARMGEAGRTRAGARFAAAAHLDALDAVYASLSRPRG